MGLWDNPPNNANSKANATSMGLPANLRFPISSNSSNRRSSSSSTTTTTSGTTTSTDAGNLRVSTLPATTTTRSSSCFQNNEGVNVTNKQYHQHQYNQFPYQFNHQSSTPTTVSSSASTTFSTATPTSSDFVSSHYATLAAQNGFEIPAPPPPSSQSSTRYHTPQTQHPGGSNQSLYNKGGANSLGREGTAGDPMGSLFLDHEPQPLSSSLSSSSLPFPPHHHNHNWMHLPPPPLSQQQQQQREGNSSSFKGHDSYSKGTSLAFSVRNSHDTGSGHSKKDKKKGNEDPSDTSDPEGNETEKSNRKKLYAVALLATVISIALVVGVPVGLTQQISKSSPEDSAAGNISASSSSTTAETSTSMTLAPWTLYPPVDQVFSRPLQASTRTAIESQDDSLPQVLAYQWLTQDPNLERYSTPQLQQRLALATFYFATRGDSWFGVNTSNNVDDDIENGGSDTLQEKAVEIVNEIDTNFENSIVHWLDYQRHECEWYNLAEYQGFPVCYNFTPTEQAAASTANMSDPWGRHYDYQSLVLSIDPFFVSPPNATLPNPIMTPILQGKLPPEMALLTSLERLEVQHQKLKGRLPTELGLLSNTLHYLKLNNNYWTGIIPPALFHFPRLFWLSHNDRLDSTSIPTTIGLNTHLTELLLIESQLTGTIPTELMKATSLQKLLIGNNQLQGRLPPDIGGLGSSLQQLNVVDNQLTGPLPSELGRLMNLEYLLFDANRFTGSLPRTLSMLRKLNRLEGQSNHLGGTMPPELFATTWLVQTSATANDPDETPKILKPTWPQLTTFNFQANKLEGPIPTEIGLLQSIRVIQMSYNRLSGPIPSEVGLLTTLRSMNLFNNRLSGTVPTEIGLLGTEAGSLTSLDLGDNDALNGTVPIALCDGTVSVLWSNNLECPSAASSSSSSAMLSPTTNNEGEDKDDDMEDEDPTDENDD